MTDGDATVAFYDTVAASYAETVVGTDPEAPLDLGFLEQFVSSLPPGDTPVLDAGCGTGRLLTYLADHGVGNLAGIDLSSQMIALAEASHPSVPLNVGDLSDLPYSAGSVRGILCWYAIIHTGATELDPIAAQFARVLQTGGVALFAFQSGEGARVIERAYGHDVTLTAVLHTTASVSRTLERHGLRVIAVGDREPVQNERSSQGFVIARKP